MSRVLNLEQMLALVKHGFHEGSSAEDHFFVQQQQTVRHVALQMGEQPYGPRLEQFARQGLRDVAIIAA